MRDRKTGGRRPSPLLWGLLAVASLFGCASAHGGYSVSGRVVDGTSTAGMIGVVVSLGGSGLPDATTDADGAFLFEPVPAGTYKLLAAKAGKVFSISCTAPDGARDPAELNLYGGNVTDLVISAVDADKLTIAMIQGRGLRSPMEGQAVENLRGVITKITRQRQNGNYTVTQTDGSITPQWVDVDGFYMESLAADIDGEPSTSDGIFVCTHNHNFAEPKLLDTVPTDLAVGQVVAVSGIVAEVIPVNRFGDSESYLSVTRIEDPVVFQMKNAGIVITQAPPDGVLLTYEAAPAGLSGDQYRTLPWEDDSVGALDRAISVLESVEGMTVKVNQPVTTGSTYYNVTPILADGGLKAGSPNKDATSYGGMVIRENDFNAEILYCDYAPPTWRTFTPLPQTGDSLKDSLSVPVLRGVVDYTFDGIYWISPLATQGYGFTPVAGRNDKIRTSAIDQYKPWRIGKTADSQFTAPWPIVRDGDLTDANLTAAAFNIENYCLEEDGFKKYEDIADVLLYNLRAPDLITVVEMGDDKASTIVFVNQDNAYAIPDGVTWAVENFRAIIDTIKTKSLADMLTFGGAIEYDFREIAPEENVDGGEPGTNIRVGFLFRRDRLQFIDRGIRTNAYDATGGAESTWTVPGDVSSNPRLIDLAQNNTTVAGITGQDGIVRPRLTQSPGRINAAPFRSSRKPLCGEFLFLPTGKTFFAIACHFGSKTGDAPLYGVQQPPTFNSEPRRIEQGRAVNELVKAILAVDPNAKIVVAGDLNDFQFSLTNKAMTGAAYGRARQVLFSPSEELLPAIEQYSYVFRGNSQQIDHIYVSHAIFDNIATGNSGRDAVCIPHIDSIFAQNNNIETSDHDPIVVRLNLGGL
jgi:predicted extracellular nuclease